MIAEPQSLIMMLLGDAEGHDKAVQVIWYAIIAPICKE
jgi:hypothetical protein